MNVTYLFGEPIKEKDFKLFWFRFSQIMHNKTNGKFNLLIQYLAKKWMKKIELPSSKILSDKEIIKIVSKLKKDGYCILPFKLPDSYIKFLINFCINTHMYSNEGNALKFDSEKLFYDEARYYWKMQDLIENITIQKILSDSIYAKIAQEYIGVMPILTSISLWLDPPSKNKTYSPHIYHQDNDGVKYLKFFFYLTDVDEKSCPHRFIKGSHLEIKPKQFSLTKRYTNEELLNFYGKEQEIIFTAPAGTIIAEDTKGFHRGSTPKSKYRLLLQLEFAMFDIPVNFRFCKDKNIKKLNVDMNSNLKKIYRKFFI